MRQRRAWPGMANSAESARQATCRVTNNRVSVNKTKLSDRSTRYGGQKIVIVPWLLPANSAIATATPKSARNHNAARIFRCLPSRCRSGERGQRFIDARQLQRRHLGLNLL